MNRRLQQFLELEQLKPAQFADIMGIQRSNVSHILSGRNKPGFDFIQKFLLKFPSVRTRQAPAGTEHPRSCSQAAGLLPRPVRPVHRTGSGQRPFVCSGSGR